MGVPLAAIADRNSLRYWCAMGGLYLAMSNFGLFPVENVFARVALVVLLQVGLNVVLDYFNYIYGLSYYDPEVVIQRGYNISAYTNDTLHGMGLDYGFNFYDGDYGKDRAQAQRDKFECAIEQLGIQRGDRVIDIGCGCGDWLMYLQTEYDCTVAGVNITEAQVNECKKRGLQVYLTNWKDIAKTPQLRDKLWGKFDVVSFWDTVEHYVPSKYYGFRDKQDEIYRDMFTLAKNLLDSDSPRHKIWISCLHMARKVHDHEKSLLSMLNMKMIRKMWYIYILDRFHSGFYPSYYFCNHVQRQRDQLVENAKTVSMECVWRKNVTYDYYITSVLEPTHFGRHKFKMTLLRALYLMSFPLTDPHWLHRYLWFITEDWMCQFDREDINNSDVILWWLVFQV